MSLPLPAAPGQVRRNSVLGPKVKSVARAWTGKNAHVMKLSPLEANRVRAAIASRHATTPERRLAATGERLLVLYDGWSTDRYVSEMFGEQLVDLLSHFGYGIDFVNVTNYTAGMIGTHKATFYLGVLYDTPLNTAFKNDVMNATKPVCWMGYNLWSLAWTSTGAYNKTFENKFGFRFQYLDSGYTSVTYKSQLLNKMDQDACKMSVLSSAKASVICRAKTDAGSTIPYVIKSGNLWVVADNPLSTVDYSDIPNEDRTLVFCDIIHDILNTGQVESHPALLRIEDVSSTASPALLRQIADILSAEGVPFVISTIPFYRDPMGYWNNGVGYEIPLSQAPEVVSAINYMVSKGGQVIQHGTTHQYGDGPNPYHGVTGEEWEFFRMGLDGTTNMDNYVALNPVPEDSPTWVHDRVMTGKNALAALGWNVTGWLTPHYLASEVDYQEFAKTYEYKIDPTINFRVDPSGNLFYQSIFSPYPYKDHNGMVTIPETVNYISPYVPYATPSDIITRAKKMKVVRDGWASMYFHPFLDPAQLRTAVRGIKNAGFKFVNPSKALGPVAK